MRSGNFLVCDDDRRRPRSEDFRERSSGALDLEFLPDVRRRWGSHSVSHFDDDRRVKNSRRQQAFRNRLTDSMDLDFRVDVGRRPVRRDYKDDDMPYRATIPEKEIVAVTQKRRSSRQSWKPARAEFLGSTGELQPRRRTAHFYPTQMSANHNQANGKFYVEDDYYFCYFDGESQIDEYVEWEQKLEESFEYLNIYQEERVSFAASKLVGRAKVWWKLIKKARRIEGCSDVKSWRKMKKLLRAQFLSSEYVNEMEEEKIESNTTIGPSIEIRVQTKENFHNFIEKEESSSELEFNEEGEARNGEERENNIVDTGRSLVEVINQSQLYEKLAPLEGKVKKIAMKIKKIKEKLTKNKPRESKLVPDIQKKCYNKKDLISVINGFDIKKGDWASIWKLVEEMPRRDVVSWNMIFFILSVRKILSSGMWLDKVALASIDSTCVSFGTLNLLKWALEYIKKFLLFLSLRAMCGIFVVLGCPDDSQAKRVRVLELSRRLRHRGPDLEPIFLGVSIWLAMVPSQGSGGTLGLNESCSFLDISDIVHYDSALGVMGLAFHPNLTNNGRFFVSYNCDKTQSVSCSGRCSCNSDMNCDPTKFGLSEGAQTCRYQSIISKFTINSSSSTLSEVTSASPSEVRRIFTLRLPYIERHGGQIIFGSDDGPLYFMMGDGGNDGDPFNLTQYKKSLLGKIIKIGVHNLPSSSETNDLGLWGNYSIPKDKPSAEDKQLQPEIWALGLQNPWRCSFDSGRPSYFFCGVVGQETYEEVFEQTEEAATIVEKLSEEFLKVQKDLEQKGKIDSAMLREAKHDTTEKQALLKEVVSNLNKRGLEEQQESRIKDDFFEKEAKRIDLGDKLRAAQIAVEESRKKTNKEVQDHMFQIIKHKATFTELISKQRQLEVEMVHMLCRVDYPCSDESTFLAGGISSTLWSYWSAAKKKGR